MLVYQRLSGENDGVLPGFYLWILPVKGELVRTCSPSRIGKFTTCEVENRIQPVNVWDFTSEHSVSFDQWTCVSSSLTHGYVSALKWWDFLKVSQSQTETWTLTCCVCLCFPGVGLPKVYHSLIRNYLANSTWPPKTALELFRSKNSSRSTRLIKENHRNRPVVTIYTITIDSMEAFYML